MVKEYKRMIDTGEAKNQSELARKPGVSRVHISQVLSLLKINVEIIEAIEYLRNQMQTRFISDNC